MIPARTLPARLLRPAVPSGRGEAYRGTATEWEGAKTGSAERARPRAQQRNIGRAVGINQRFASQPALLRPGRGRSGEVGCARLGVSLQSLLAFCFLLVAALGIPAPASAQSLPGGDQLAFSYSGQFVVTGSAEKSLLVSLPAVTTNSTFVRLDPALLSVSAERLKQALYRLLGLPSVRDWQGKIFLAMHPALWTDENVTVVAKPLGQTWCYLVQIPDVVQRDRFVRGLTGALLLELANRQSSADGHCADLPVWLMDGLSRDMLQDELAEVVVTEPNTSLDDFTPPKGPAKERELDPLAAARQVLRTHPALTYDQLCWPTDAQLAGQDDGVYHASAQLFVSELLNTKDGPARLRSLLQTLPQAYNWQTAFQSAFHDEFARPLDLEKWWALSVVDFLSHDPGPVWTPAYSAGRLNELLQVPVAVRVSSNSLPTHATISLQAVVQDFAPARQSEILETRLRDLRVAQFRMARQFIALNDAYCQVLAGYLGERLGPTPRSSSLHHPVPAPVRLKPGEFVRRLNALDARRQMLEATVNRGTDPKL